MKITRSFLAAYLFLTLCASGVSAETLHRFTKIQLSDTFYGEGAAIGDFNGDGVQDVASGPFWYAGPEFKERHEIYPPKPFDPHQYSDNFLMFSHDFNGNGRTDLLIVGFPGAAAHWFENPGKESGHWKRHEAYSFVGNESPFFAPIIAEDEQPKFVFNTETHLGYAEIDPENPEKPWLFVPVSGKGEWHQFTHGLGAGDVNGDGRLDLLTHHGWWEQPESVKNAPEWKWHPVDFGPGGVQMFAYDVDGDGRNDVITVGNAHGWGLHWYRQEADGSFSRQVIMGARYKDNLYGVRFSQPHALALVDIDGDGLRDLVSGKRFWAHGPDGDVEPNAPAVLYWFKLVQKADGTADFLPFRIDEDSGVGTQLTTGDISGNGFPDLVIGNKKGTFVFLNEPIEVSREEWERAQPQVIPARRTP